MTYKNFSVKPFSVQQLLSVAELKYSETSTYNHQMDFIFLSNEDFLPKAEAAKIKEKAIALMTTSV
jgi:hypothetical protein